jgi:chaperonin GroES
MDEEDLTSQEQDAASQDSSNTQSSDDDYGNDGSKERSVSAFLESHNLAKKLKKEELEEIGKDAKKGFEQDERSRGEWNKAIEKWTELAKLTAKQKTFPWPNASNVKFPLLATAAMQFAARAYPSLLPSDGGIVKCRVVGKDPDGKKTDVAEAVSIYMSYQLMDEMEGWEEEMDRMLIMLPIVGTMFKKTYWDPIKKVNCSRLVLPQNLVVDYWAKNLREAERISEILELNPRIVKERVQSGLWLDVDLPDPSLSEQVHQVSGSAPSETDDSTPWVFVEQHTYLDLDEDGYKEPYIVTFHKQTGSVVRISVRFDQDTIFHNDDGEIARIEPIQYYTKYGFVPNPDGSFYDIGFGILLGPVNESVNTLINQLVDSGTINNLQSGFLGKGLRLRMGEQQFKPGEWKLVNSTGDDLKKQIVPLPSKEPSKVLFELLQALITAGKELASVAEIFTGKMPGQNTPATTTMATVEQGMKVFTAVYKRIYRSLAEELKKLYRLNGIYLEPNTYLDIIDMPVGPDLFKDQDHKIVPGADPTAVSQSEKLMKAQALMEMLQAQMPLDPIKVMIRMLQAQEQPNWQELIPQQIQQTGQMPPPPPDPKMMAIQMKAQADQAKAQQDIQISQQQAALEQQSQQAQLQMKQQEHASDMQAKQQKMQLDAASQIMRDRMRAAQEQQQGQQQLQQQDQLHQQSMAHNEQQNAAKVEAAKAMAKAKPQPSTGAKK